MQRFFSILMFLIILVPFVNGQENEKHIEKEIEDLEKLISKGSFISAQIYFAKDTLEMELLAFKGKRKVNHFLFCLAKINKDSIHIYRPSDIVGYEIENITYLSHKSYEAYFFLKQLEVGKVDLYEKRSIPSDDTYLFYLKLLNEPDYFIVSPFEANMTVDQVPTQGPQGSQGVMVNYYKSNGVD